MKKIVSVLLMLAMAATVFTACSSADAAEESAVESTVSVVETDADVEEEEEEPVEEEPAQEEPVEEEAEEASADAGDIDAALIGTWSMDSFVVDGETYGLDDEEIVEAGFDQLDYTFTFTEDGVCVLAMFGMEAEMPYSLNGTTLLVDPDDDPIELTFSNGVVSMDYETMGVDCSIVFAK